MQLEADVGEIEPFQIETRRVVRVYGNITLGNARRGAGGQTLDRDRSRRLVDLRDARGDSVHIEHSRRIPLRVGDGDEVRIEQAYRLAIAIEREVRTLDGIDIETNRARGPRRGEAGVADAFRNRLADANAISLETPEKDREVWQVVSDAAVRRRFYVSSVRKRIERRRQQRQHRGIAQRHGAAANHRLPLHKRIRIAGRRIAIRRWTTNVGTLKIEVLVPDHVLEQLDTMNAPLRQVESEQLDRAERAFAPPQRDRVGNVGAQRPRIAFQMARAEQVAEVGNDPVVASLDEEIVIERFDVLVNRTERGFDQREIGA